MGVDRGHHRIGLLAAVAVSAAVLAVACSPPGVVYEEDGLTAVLRTQPWPPRARVELRLDVELSGARAAAVTPDQLRLVLSMPDMDHGETVVLLQRAGPQRYRGSARFDHGGLWDARLAGPDDATLARFQLEVGP